MRTLSLLIFLSIQSYQSSLASFVAEGSFPASPNEKLTQEAFATPQTPFDILSESHTAKETYRENAKRSYFLLTMLNLVFTLEK